MSVPGDAARLAVGTLTVLPVRPPRGVDRTTAGLAMALAPLAVLPVAAVVGGVVWLLDTAGGPPLLTATLAVAALALASGGLHLDGLADTADGFAVPGDRDRRLAVMRTGDVGPTGTATLLLVLLAQAAALSELVASRTAAGAALGLAVAVVLSRAVLAWASVRGVPAARGDGLGRAVAGSVPVPVALASLTVVAALVVVTEGGGGVAGLAVAAVVVGLVVWRAHRRLGGVTGDVLGACVELALAGYLVVQATYGG